MKGGRHKIYKKLEDLMERYCLYDKEIAVRLGICEEEFRRKKNQEEEWDFTLEECHIIKEIFNARGENLLIPEIFFHGCQKRAGK